jgi:hypothetical protein
MIPILPISSGGSIGQEYRCLPRPAVNDATLMVDPSTGYVWLAYLDWATDILWLYESTDQAATWSYGWSLQLPELLDGQTHSDKICPTQNNCIEARSMIAARLNFRAPVNGGNTIAFLFHARTAGVSQIYGVRFLMGGGWPQKFDPNGIHLLTSGNDAWDASFDFDTQGNYVASWYERQSNLQYVTKTASLSSDLSTLTGASCFVCTPSDVSIYTARGVGEYQDIWYTSSVGAWILGTVATHPVGATYQGDAVSYNAFR